MTAGSDASSLSSAEVAARIAGRYLRPRAGGLLLALLAAAVAAGLSALLVDMLQPAVNGLFGRPDPQHIVALPLALIGLALARGVAQAVQTILVNRAAAGVVGDIQIELYGRMIRADLARLRAAHSGGFVAQALYDTSLISEAASTGGVNFVQQSLTLVGAIAIMLIKDWRLALAVLLAAPLVSVGLRQFLKRAIAAASGAMQASGALSTAMMEGLDGVRVVKVETREADEEAKVAKVVRERQRHVLAGANARGLASPATEVLTMAIAAAVLAYEGWRSSRGHADVGGFVAFFAALLMAGQALRQVSNLSALIGQGLAAGRRLLSALDVEPEVRDRPSAPSLRVSEGRLVLDRVGFAYPGDETVLDGVSLEASRGEVIALVGPSGAGKSTILGLIPRFYDIDRGRLEIDGHAVGEVSVASLRRQIALVTQEPFLFDDTIGANIAYARPSADQAAIDAAARAAAAHDFIAALPEGYDTRVGEGGMRLSGGQRQRIAIARAFLKNAPILLFDEPTSALDSESEVQVRRALARLTEGRTTLVIAHRLSTVRDASRIYVLDQGRVVEVGNHAELARAGGLYARLMRSQDLSHLAPEPL